MRYILLALFIAVTLTGNAQADVISREVDYKYNNTNLKGTLFYDEAVSAIRPGIIIYPEWWGRNDYALLRAKEYANKGYVVLAADMYGNAEIATSTAQAQTLSGNLYADRAEMRGRAIAAIDFLKTQLNVDQFNIALMGFCFGGNVALEVARSGYDVKSVGAFHAGLKFNDKVKNGAVRTKVLVLNGAADTFVPFTERQAFIEEMQTAGADLQFIEYSGALHAFTNPAANSTNIPGVAYDQRAEKRSFAAMDMFLKETLGK